MKRTLKSTILCLIGITIFTTSLPNLAAQTVASSEIEKVKAEVRKRGTGERPKVVVKMKDGRKIEGNISQVLDDSFDLLDAKTKQPTTIPYRDVAQVRKTGWSTAAKVGLGVAIGAGVVAAVILGAVGAKGLDGFCPLGC